MNVSGLSKRIIQEDFKILGVESIKFRFTEQSLDEFTKPQQLAGAFALRSIDSFLEEIRVQAGSVSLLDFGGEPYRYFFAVKQGCNIVRNEENLDDPSAKRDVCLASVKAIRDFVEKNREAEVGSKGHVAYAFFAPCLEKIDKVLSGKIEVPLNDIIEDDNELKL